MLAADTPLVKRTLGIYLMDSQIVITQYQFVHVSLSFRPQRYYFFSEKGEEETFFFVSLQTY